MTGLEGQLMSMLGNGGASAGSVVFVLGAYKLVNKWLDNRVHRNSSGNGNGKKPPTKDQVQLMIIEGNTKFFSKFENLEKKMDVNKDHLSNSIRKIHSRIDNLILLQKP